MEFCLKNFDGHLFLFLSSVIAKSFDDFGVCWLDDKETGDEQILCTDYPDDSISHHKTDIMSCCFDLKKFLIFTGDHEGALIGWNFDGKFPKYFLHEWDKTEPTCKSSNIQESKSIDNLVVM